MKVYVVTGLELGWDCVVGVFTNVTRAALEAEFSEDYYVITELEVQTEI